MEIFLDLLRRKASQMYYANNTLFVQSLCVCLPISVYAANVLQLDRRTHFDSKSNSTPRNPTHCMKKSQGKRSCNYSLHSHIRTDVSIDAAVALSILSTCFVLKCIKTRQENVDTGEIFHIAGHGKAV